MMARLLEWWHSLTREQIVAAGIGIAVNVVVWTIFVLALQRGW